MQDDARHSTRRSLAERRQALEQKRAVLDEKLARIKEAERKARNHRLFQLGGLIFKAGLAERPSNELYGLLLFAASADQRQREEWAQLGGRAFYREKKAQEKPGSETKAAE